MPVASQHTRFVGDVDHELGIAAAVVHRQTREQVVAVGAGRSVAHQGLARIDRAVAVDVPVQVNGNARDARLATLLGTDAVAAADFTGAKESSVWLPNEAVAKAWEHYVKDTAVPDTTPPPAPTKLQVNGNQLAWQAEADLESGLAGFIIERDGEFLAKLPGEAKNPFGRPVFQNLQYSDTPTQPLVGMCFTDPNPLPGKTHQYHVTAVNTAGLRSE